MLEHLSSSQISLYLQCGLKYRFQFIDLIPRPFKPSAIAFGSVIHSTLAWFHKEMMKGKEVTLERLFKVFDSDWYSQKVETDIRYRDGEDEIKLIACGKEMLSLYFSKAPKEIAGFEIPFMVLLINPSTKESLEVPIMGMIDLIEKDDVIVEFKTSSQGINAQEADDHLQLTLYSYAYQILYRRPPKLLKIINFVKRRKPKMNVLETNRGRDDYERLFYLAKEVLKGIKFGVFFPRKGYWCKDCEYQEYCKKWRG